MNPNELRLGNYVYAIDYNNSENGMVIAKVGLIGKTTLMLENLDLIHNINEIEPIELTDGILSKCSQIYNVIIVDEKEYFYLMKLK